jgi:hypothetical protein
VTLWVADKSKAKGSTWALLFNPDTPSKPKGQEEKVGGKIQKKVGDIKKVFEK